MHEPMDRPQLGGVISRTVVLSRRSAFAEGMMATAPPSSEQRKLNLRNCTSSGLRTPLFFADLEPHTLFQEPPNRCHDTLAGSFAAHEDIRIVGVWTNRRPR
jgi:hypothetical protein